MSKSNKHKSNKAGLPPGTLIHIGKKKTDKIKMSVIDYNASDYSERTVKRTEDLIGYTDTTNVSWINVDGLHNTEIIGEIGNIFQLHPLLLEDVLNTGHRPKLEDFDSYLFITLKMLGINKAGQAIISEQISIVLGKNWVLSFQEQEGDIFNGLRERIRQNKGHTRQMSVDYLMYRLIDTVVDNYFHVTEFIAETTEKLEEEVIHESSDMSLRKIQKLKKELINLRKTINPIRETISILQKDNSGLIQSGTLRYLRDVYEHTIQLNDILDSQRDMVGSIMELYLTGLSNRMNKVMQVLTIIATIFIPLTFIAGVYGMNFENMPELKWEYGYVTIWIVMLITAFLLGLYFKRKKWL
jgi:magnesium transporter